MKTAHIADLHHNPERNKKVLRILSQVEEIAPDVELLTNSGENFQNPYNLQHADPLLDKWERITKKVPVATVRGTMGQHERPGMVEILKRVGVCVLEPGKEYALSKAGRIIMQDDGYEAVLPKLLIYGIPHPHVAHILSKDKNMRLEEANAKINNAMTGLYKRVGAMRSNNPGIPALAVGHGVVRGKNTRDIKALSSDIYSTEAEIGLMACDFYAWGHYHNPVEFSEIPGRYLGSFAWDFNELDYKPAITIIDWDTMEITRHELDINIRKKLIMKPGDIIPDLTGCDVHLINDNTEWTEADCKEKGADQVKVTTETEIVHKIRSIEVMEAKTYPEKFKSVYPEATERQLTVSEEFWLQDVAAGKIPQKKVITPLWAKIHGSMAFMERLGKETVELDLRNGIPGLMMLIGPGGHGKSTLIDYISPFSVLFLQANSLISTFELDDSYIHQEYDINGDIYRIEKRFKPTLKMPTAKYYAFKNGEPVPGLTGNRKPFDEWCVNMFGTPRKYASSVIHTQFDDNKADFQGQPINPSVFQATNIELKGLFHELAGTDLKHVEMKCKNKSDGFSNLIAEETIKRAGVEENIPDKSALESQVTELQDEIIIKEGALIVLDTLKTGIDKKIEAIKNLDAENTAMDGEITALNDQKTQEESKKTDLETNLTELGNVDVESLNRDILAMEDDKLTYDKKLKNLPGIQKGNKDLKTKYDGDVQTWNDDNLTITTHNTEVQTKRNAKASAIRQKEAAERSIERAKQKATDETTAANKRSKDTYDTTKSTLESEIEGLRDRVKDGTDRIDSIKPCEFCNKYATDADATRTHYTVNRDKLKKVLESKEIELSEIKPPDPTTIEPEITDYKNSLEDAEKIISLEISATKTVSDKPKEPEYGDETIPTFDSAKYESLKEKVAGYSEDKVTELRTKISECQKRISDIDTQIKSKVKHVIDRSPETNLETVKSDIKVKQDAIAANKTEVTTAQARIADIDKLRESLTEYDKRIAEYDKEFDFWSDMRIKWGPGGIPARILEHTGPYVDEMANNLLAKYYPIYKVHSETTRMSGDGKKELEIFNISIINQETGREKPINSLSGEERNFVSQALREAFRTIDKENSMVEWMILYEDEPDKYVSTDFITQFWDMVEHITGNKRSICVTHKPEIKHRSQMTIDIREV